MVTDTFETITYETIDDGTIARIALNRPEKRNAQNSQMLYEVHDAFMAAALDDSVKVIVLKGEGPMFSSGHDIRGGSQNGYTHDQIFPYSPGLPGSEGYMNREQEIYFQWCRRIHDIPKPTIAQVHGKVIAGGLMLMWVCDLIVAADNSEFIDITAGPQFMVQGVEWFSHPWELGTRKAKEMLFTGDPVTAAEAYNLGMINHVVPLDDLEETTLALARKIAARSNFGLNLAKMAVNQALDAQGFWTAQQAAFNLQHLGHTHSRVLGMLEAQKQAAAEQAAPAPDGVTTAN
ncbi:MAG TPA: enoyl-CoA hydratase [Acidimicrobiia bacterium]|nr:enoyl-CoA hydratase [Acidimicrobiia bacterium]